MSQQSFLRPDDIQTFHRETILTPNGFKTVRIYAAADESMNSMNKVRHFALKLQHSIPQEVSIIACKYTFFKTLFSKLR